jgi:phosphatidylglycerophosphatase A
VLLVTGLGSGFIRPGPGTWGSLAALAIWWFALAGLVWWAQVLVILATLLTSVWLVARVARRYGVDDDPGIVVDEFVGLWIALVAAPPNLPVALAGFVLFRVLDVWKPGPVRFAERRAPGAWGVMLDDVVAGVLAAAVLQVSLRLVA